MGILITLPKTGGRTLDFDETTLSDADFKLALQLGLEAIAGMKMSKVGAQTKLEGDDLIASYDKAEEIAKRNLSDLVAGTFKKGGRGKSAGSNKIPREVMTEARRLAKEIIKNEIRAAGMKISHVEPREITAAANNLIDTDPSFIEQAKANIEARNAVAPVIPEDESAKATAKSKLAALGLAGESPKLLAAAEERKAKSKAVLSATQAGKAAPRKGAQATAH